MRKIRKNRKKSEIGEIQKQKFLRDKKKCPREQNYPAAYRKKLV